MLAAHGSSASHRRASSKLKSMSVNDRMLLQLPRIGLSSEEQLDYLDHKYQAGGQPAMQALLNLMDSGVVDGVIWKRESWVGDSIGSVTGTNGDRMDLMDPIAMPPTGGCCLLNTEGVVESMWNQLHSSVDKAMTANAASTEPLDKLAVDVPRQVVMLVARIRFTAEVQRCIRENRQLGTVTRANQEIKKRVVELLLDKEMPEGQRATLSAIAQVIHEQNQVLSLLTAMKSEDEVKALWQEQMKFFHDEKEKLIELRFGDKTVPIGNEYSPPCMLITTEFTHTLRWAYLEAMCEGGSRLLVLIGAPGCGKTAMLQNVGQLIGKMPTCVRVTETTTKDEVWWRRRFTAANLTSGGPLAPVIITQAHRAPEGALDVALSIASELNIALCVTMSPGPEAQFIVSDVLAGATVINVPASDLKTIAAGQLSAQGLANSDTLAVPLATILESLKQECSKQQHYDFGPRTLMQLCHQIGCDRRKDADEKVLVSNVVERCILPKLTKADVPILKRLLVEQFKIDKILVSASEASDGRWHKVAENIRSITKHEPDCIVLPVPAADEATFEDQFCKMLNRNGSMMVKLPGVLADLSPADLLGSMPKKNKDGIFEPEKDGLLVAVLRKAMEDNVDPSQMVWIYMMTGNISGDKWECLHELLNDSGQLNLPTGEQLRLHENLRFLFVMPNAGNTPQDTFSRAAVVYTDPPAA